jgi:hypothetical protein
MRWAVLWLLALVVLAGCGAQPDGAAEPALTPAATATPTPSATATPTKRPIPPAPRPEPTPRPRPKPKPDPEPTLAPRDGPVLGADMSWPQCPEGMGIPEKRSHGAPPPTSAAEYVVLGLTNGPGFVRNPCLPTQVEWVRSRGLMIAAYAVGSFPDAATVAQHGTSGPFDGSAPLGALRNTGYQQARYNATSMLLTGLETPIVWIDVEPVPDFEWSADPVANAAVVEGLARGYREAGYRIGVYSTPYLWEQIVGDFSLGVPEWRAAGETSMEEALSRCGDDWVIQGGSGVLGQWVEDGRDRNLTCPGVSADLDRWFHQY